MPTRITHFLHHNDVPGSEVVGTAFNATARHTHDLHIGVAPLIAAKKNFFGIVDSIQIVLGTLAGGASKVTIRVTEDLAGNITIVPDTEATLALGIGDPTIGCAVFKVQTIIRQDLAGPGNGNLYLWVKVDAGSAVFSGSQIAWQE